MTNRPRVQLWFSDFWHGFEPDTWGPVEALRRDLEVEVTPSAKILVCGPYGRRHVRHVGTKVFWTHEPHAYDESEFDFTVGFDFSERPTHLRFPSFATHLLEHRLSGAPCERPPYGAWRRRPGFCNFIYDNDGPRIRKELFAALSRRRLVVAPGRVCNNAPPIPGGRWVADWRARKLAYQRAFRFTIAFESQKKIGYTSEKCPDALLAGTIPIYWGNPAIGRDVDATSLIVADDFGTLDELAEYVCAVDDEEARAQRRLEQSEPFVRKPEDWMVDLTAFFQRVRHHEELARRGSQRRRAAALTLSLAGIRLRRRWDRHG